MICGRCKNERELAEIAKGKTVCKACERIRHNARYSQRRERLIEYVMSRRNYKEFHAKASSTPEGLQKVRARKRLSDLVREGRIKRPTNCESCGVACKPNGHHEDYSKPLDVQWLCSTCHGLVHRK